MLKSNDLQATIDFYSGVLGFVLDSASPPHDPRICFLDHGPVHLCFYLDLERRDPEPCLSGQLYFHVEDVRAYHRRIKDEVEIVWGPEVYSYGRREFAVRDPNGYILTFSEPSDDPPQCPD